MGKNNIKRSGRHRLKLDEEKIGQLAFFGNPDAGIATILGVSPKTITNNYSNILAKKRAERRAALRAAQTKAALEGNIAMLIFLGKNELEQKDRQDVETPGLTRVLYEVSERFLPVIPRKKKGDEKK